MVVRVLGNDGLFERVLVGVWLGIVVLVGVLVDVDVLVDVGEGDAAGEICPCKIGKSSGDIIFHTVVVSQHSWAGGFV